MISKAVGAVLRQFEGEPASRQLPGSFVAATWTAAQGALEKAVSTGELGDMATFARTLIAYSDAHPEDARAAAHVAKLFAKGEAALADMGVLEPTLTRKVLDLRAKRT